MGAQVEVKTGYFPREHQEQIHSSLRRFNVLVCHRRFGKTVLSVNEILDQGLRCDKHRPQYAYIAPNYGQAKRVAWDILKDAVKDIPDVNINEADLRVDIPRPWKGDFIRIMLLSGENPDSIRGLYLDGVILDEYADCPPDLWALVVRATLSDRLGWAIFIGTPKGQNHFHDIYSMAKKDIAQKKEEGKESTWFVAVYKASETKIVPQEELDEAKITMSEEQYDQEFQCSFTAALVGAYYGKQIAQLEAKQRIRRVPHDEALAVNTYWDLGMNDTTCIWFIQKMRNEYRVIDFHEESGMGIPHYAKVLRERAREFGYSYEKEYWPHDGAVKDLSTGVSRAETWKDAFGRMPVILPRLGLQDGIDAVRRVLPMCYFDAVKCDRGIIALKNYQKKWDSKAKIYQNTPKHDWASHPADGFRMFAIAVNQIRGADEMSNLPSAAQDDWSVI